tara:strand:- start:26120 stop:29470 length:3351 start_codon:yes stop_codon:yes gene_type:complete
MSVDKNATGGTYSINPGTSGPGSYQFGRDEVYYIGTQQQTAIEYAFAERREIYRWYSGRRGDHLYYDQVDLDDNVPMNPARYNKEPRNGREVFLLSKDSHTGNTAVYLHYDAANFNSYLSSSSTGAVRELGYIWTSQAAATTAGVVHPTEDLLPLYHYRRADPVDDLYTTDPTKEVNLQTDVAGVPNTPNPLNQDYQYQGIYGYVFNRTAPRYRNQYVDVGKPINTGEVNRSNWYNWTGGFSELQYNAQSPPASTLGWGNPDNVEINDDKANFEWFYGKNGAVKACLPRFLGFHDAFEGQFVYYLYDTTFPFSGPIYGINLITTDAPCNPSTADCPHDPHTTYHSYYYEMREDAWATKKTHISVDAPNSGGLPESFWAVGTDDLMVFFRYTTETGFYTPGETINGWLIQSVRYFGDELRCGYMRLQTINGVKGSVFTYQSTYTSTNGGTASILAGYGIPDKAAFFGVYEFPKKLSYYKAEIDNDALIPQRNFDEAVLQAYINEKGEIEEIEIINAGKDYKDPEIIISIPDIRRVEGFTDTAANIPEMFTDGISGEPQLNFQTTEDFEQSNKAGRKVAKYIEKQKFETDAGYTKNVKQAKASIILNEEGCIKNVTILDPGAGYQPGEEVGVRIVERDKESREDTFIGGDTEEGAGVPGMQSAIEETLDNEDTPKEVRDAMQDPLRIMKEGFKSIDTSIQTDYVTGYIGVADLEKDEKTKFCDKIPSECLSPDMGKNWYRMGNILDPSTYANGVSSSPGGTPMANELNKFLSPTISNNAAHSNYLEEKTSNGLPGMFGGACLETFQAKLYGVKRFFDVPCPTAGYDQYGKYKTYGFIPYKYCGSKEEFAQVRVSISVEGDVSKKGEAVNQAFLDWLESLPKPTLTRPRPVEDGSGNDKTGNSHACNRGGNLEGRCFANGDGTYSFVPEAGDENTFDFYGSELEKLATWVGPNNYSSYGSGTVVITDTMLNPPNNTYTHTYNTIQFASCTNGKFPNPCWHNFIADGVLNVYSGYDNNGNGLASDDICTGQPFSNPSTWVQSSTLNQYGQCAALQNIVHSTVAFDTGKTNEDNPYISLGPFNGNMHWANYLPGATHLLTQSLKRYGNPYFDECDIIEPEQ